MSVVQDSRKLLQDFVTPELRAIKARLAALEKRFDEAQARTEKRFDEAQARTDKRFDEADKREREYFATFKKHAQERFEMTLAGIRQLHTVHDLELRLAKIEALSGLGKHNPTAEARQ